MTGGKSRRDSFLKQRRNKPQIPTIEEELHVHASIEVGHFGLFGKVHRIFSTREILVYLLLQKFITPRVLQKEIEGMAQRRGSSI